MSLRSRGSISKLPSCNTRKPCEKKYPIDFALLVATIGSMPYDCSGSSNGLLGFDYDNGSRVSQSSPREAFLTERRKPVIFTPSHAYQKEDNAHREPYCLDYRGYSLRVEGQHT